MDGLRIDITGFEKLHVPQKLTILYQNTEELKKMVKAYKFHQKFQYILIGILFVLAGGGKYFGFI